MLRVSSYRKLFEQENWGRNGGLSVQCAGQYRLPVRGAVTDECCCGDKLDFVAAKALNKEGLNRFVQERSTIAFLNDRLVRLIEVAHCFEEQNEALQCQITELEEKLTSQNADSSIKVKEHDCSLDAVVERLRVQRDEVLGDTQKLKKELEHLKEEYEWIEQQKMLIWQEQNDVATEVDAVTAECLALKEQVAIYEDQLAVMGAQHKEEVESLLEPDERTLAAAAITFGSPDIAPALNVKEYHCQLAKSLQFERGTSSALAVRRDGEKLEEGRTAGSKVKDLPEDASELKTLISELQKELCDLEKDNEELEDEVELRSSAHMEEVADLECSIVEMRQQEADLEVQMREQCDDYKELLNEKMARDMEIAAYRSLVEEEEGRFCSL
ncbi:glial fibrillary acidic protein [Oryzias latipes]|uniref:IF rod domain-containing protein n=1 Tax=Oryzias latipes TaxID=8090 RepID=H2L6N1_ORYLA|nr:glial fibrillary acidic protein [Oryzias latipes]